MNQRQAADFQRLNRRRHAIIGNYAKRVYAVYPLRAKEPAALMAIRRALVAEEGRGHLHADGPLHAAFLYLKSKTEEYTATRGGDLETYPFVPFADWWFRHRRYRDAPATWLKTNGKAKIAEPDYSKGFYDC